MKEQTLEQNKLDSMDLGSEPDIDIGEAPAVNTIEQGEVKEVIHLKFRSGEEIQLGSCSVSCERLCELAHILKLNVMNDVSKTIPNYFG